MSRSREPEPASEAERSKRAEAQRPSIEPRPRLGEDRAPPAVAGKGEGGPRRDEQAHRSRSDEQAHRSRSARHERLSRTSLERALRSARLELKRLRQERDEALAQESRGSLLSALYDDLLGPLQTLSRLVDELGRSPGAAPVASLRSCCARLRLILDRSHDYALLEAGELRLAEESLALRGLLLASAELGAIEARAKGLAFTLDAEWEGELWVSGDGPRLRQILHELISNAVRCTEQGEVRLSARVQPSRREGYLELHLKVEDTGHGIPRDQQSRVFRPFVALEALDGSGLGLTLASRLADRMGGQLRLESQPGCGSRFFLSLELRAIPGLVASGAAPPARRRDSARAALPRAEAGLVLLADDDELHQLWVQGLLGSSGELRKVSRGLELLKVCREEAPGLVLLDVALPGVDGWQSLMLLREEERREGREPVPLALMGAFLSEDDRVRASELGAQACLDKPLNGLPTLERPDAGPLGAASLPVVDWGYGLRRCMGKRDLLLQIVGVFLEETPGLLKAAEQALGAGDAAALRHAAHTVKGMAVNLGARQILEWALCAETLAHAGELEACAPALVALRAAFEEAGARAREFCGSST